VLRVNQGARKKSAVYLFFLDFLVLLFYQEKSTDKICRLKDKKVNAQNFCMPLFCYCLVERKKRLATFRRVVNTHEVITDEEMSLTYTVVSCPDISRRGILITQIFNLVMRLEQ
jgi:hypothetical protein